MGLKILEQGITAIQSGSLDEGARLIKFALRRGDLTNPMRAVAYLWLAETTHDESLKREYYTEALEADPNNQDAQQRLTTLMKPSLPTVAPVMSSAKNTSFNVAEHVVRISGTPNGPGTGFFVTQDGIVATTRYLVGNVDQVVVELHIGQQVMGQVLRAFPNIDLALIRVEARLPETMPITNLTVVPEDSPLVVVNYDGEMIQGFQRPTQRLMAQFWVPTTFTRIPDNGGDPIFDERNYLVGMMTKNTSRTSSHLFGLHISAIRKGMDAYLQEAREPRVYCSSCGSRARSGLTGYAYCEVCGTVLSYMQNQRRVRKPEGDYLYEAGSVLRRCSHCGTAPSFGGRCLRCGQSLMNVPNQSLT